jgi:hypothetical protein
VARLQKLGRKSVQDICSAVIFFICPEKGLLERLIPVISVILRVNAVADYKDLYVLIQRRICTKGMTLVSVNLVEGFF